MLLYCGLYLAKKKKKCALGCIKMHAKHLICNNEVNFNFVAFKQCLKVTVKIE